MLLDSHQHFWSYNAAEYPWIPAGSPLHRDWLPDDIAPLLSAARLDGCIAVQARQTIDESAWLLDLADRHPIIKGVVGWVDLRGDDVGRQLAKFTGRPKFRGVRHVVQDEPDNDFMLEAAFQRGIAELHQFGLTYDILIYPRQFPAAIALVRKFPDQPFVLDHIAKPSIATGVLEPWKAQVKELARSPNVFCKISGMVTEAERAGWKPSDFTPFLDVVSGAFGMDRLMFGSDWPVCLLAATYSQTVRIVRDYFAEASDADRLKIFGGNAARFYGIPESAAPTTAK